MENDKIEVARCFNYTSSICTLQSHKNLDLNIKEHEVCQNGFVHLWENLLKSTWLKNCQTTKTNKTPYQNFVF